MTFKRLLLSTFNVWHGLDHTRPKLMFPSENPLAHWMRKRALSEALKASIVKDEDTLQVVCLQELNPIDKRLKKLTRELNMQGRAYAVNVGVRIGSLSYPVFLQDGLAILWHGALKESNSEKSVLSGSGLELRAPFGIEVCLQLAERRAALLVRGKWEGLDVAFINLHLHAGPPELGRPRRLGEITALLKWQKEFTVGCDAVFIAGDFNAERGTPEIDLVEEAGFTEALDPSGNPIVTWDPITNPVCAKSAQLARDDETRAWDSVPRHFDHVFIKRKSPEPEWKIEARRVFDTNAHGAWLSDHFGLQVEVTWAQT